MINFAPSKTLQRMKKTKYISRTAVALILTALTWTGLSSKPRRQASAKATFTITTTELGRNVKGYRGPVPVSVTFSKGKITAVKPLANHETPAYWQRVEKSGICEKFIGLTPGQAATKQVDAVTGATLSSRALIENIRLAAREAKKR